MKIDHPETLEDVRNARVIALSYLKASIAALEQNATYSADIHYSMACANDAAKTLESLFGAVGRGNYFSNLKEVK